MAANVNINRNLSDQFYRYKMPKLVAKVEGKGNGIKTVIVNMPEIAKSLNRPPMYPTKYFGCLLGAQVNFDNKSERYIVNGAHDPNKLQDLLDGFIQKYVLCQNCQNPETILSVSKKKEIIGTNCMACGHSGTIPAANDRVAAYILKNPPPKPAAAAAPTAAAAAAAAAAAESQAPAGADISSSNNDDADDDDWGEDTNEDAVRERMDQLSAGAKSLMLNDDLERPLNEKMQILLSFVENKAQTSDLKVGEHIKAIKGEADRLDISDKAVIVLCQALFKDGKIIETVRLYRNLFLIFTHDNLKAQKYLLRGLEITISESKELMLEKVPKMFQIFYELDIVVEDAFLDWYAKLNKKSNKLDATTKEILDKARPFIQWLQEASEESDEEDENVDVDFDDRLVGDAIRVDDRASTDAPNAQGNNSKTKTEPSSKATLQPSHEPPAEDEIDIDAI